MTGLEVGQNAPEVRAQRLVNDIGAFLRDGVGALSTLMFIVIEFGIVTRFLHHAGAASGAEITHFCIILFMPAMLLISVLGAYLRIKRTLALMDADPEHLETIMRVFQALVMAAFLTTMVMIP